MKRLIAILIVLVLGMSILLTSCSVVEVNVSDETEAATKGSLVTNKPTEKPTEKPTQPNTDKTPQDEDDTTEYVYLHSYIDEDTFDDIKSIFETEKSHTTAYSTGGAPYVMADLFGLSDSTLKSISIPVMKTGDADSNGDFTFTLSVFNNDTDSIKGSSALRTYELKISASQYGLEAKKENIYKFITVDLSSYDIKLAEDEALAVFSATDTLIPGYLASDASKTNPIYNILKKEAPQMLSFSTNCGSNIFDLESNSLLFNFTFERVYIGKDAYDAVANEKADMQMMINALKEEYGGLKLSVFGDSISTYEGVSNNTDYNSTIGGNAIWYHSGAINEAGLFDHTYTYWGSMLRELEMELCVDNAWSGDSLGAKRWVTRAEQLHNKNGEDPDVIVVYFGINDTWADGREVGELLTLIENRGSKGVYDVIGEWYERTVAKNGECTYWDELYASLLHKLMTEYPAAKIVCVGLVLNGAENFYYNCDKWVPLYNEALKAMTDYLGITYVDQTNVITGENCHAYMHDYGKQQHSDGQMKYWGYLHPNAHGHRVIFEEIVRTLYKEIA